MLLRELLLNIPHIALGEGEGMVITSLCYDSRKAGRGSLFVCLAGAVADGHDYAATAYEKGCRAFMCQHALDLPADAVQIVTPDTRRGLALASAAFFGNPAEEMTVIGVTGTAGKTTAALLTQKLLLSAGIPAGYIGSNGVQYGDICYETANTTPESYELHAAFRQMRSAGMQAVVLEVSSQALYLNRVYGIRFDGCLYTNLGLDHVDEHEHPTFEHYRDCKASLFRDHGCRFVVYNADDEHHGYMLQGCGAAKKISYGMQAGLNLSAEGWKKTEYNGFYGAEFILRTEQQELLVRTPLPGQYNIYNILGALGICAGLGIDPKGLIPALEEMTVPGRFQQIRVLPECSFIIDYAHNGVSLRSVLQAVREYGPKRVVCLFGSVGGRTQSRRAELGKAAAELADVCVLTSDNPNFEPPEDVIRDIAAYMEGSSCQVVGIPDREEAVEYVVRTAKPGDAVILAGKGHEDYQLIRGKKIPFREEEILHRCMKKYLTVL